MRSAMSKLPLTDPMWADWEKYRATADYENSKHWAMRVAPMFQVGEDRAAVCDLMPIEQRSRHVDGSMWAAFVAGYEAALRRLGEIKD